MSILDKIVATKQQELAALPAADITVDSLRAQVAARGGVRDFTAALAEPRSVGEAVVVFLMTLLPSHSRHEWFAHHPALQLREVHRSPWGESLLAVV